VVIVTCFPQNTTAGKVARGRALPKDRLDQRSHMTDTTTPPADAKEPQAQSDQPPWADEMSRRTDYALAMGGADKVERQRTAGRLTARDRIAYLVDPETWQEIGLQAGTGTYDDQHKLLAVTPANVITGLAQISGRDVCIVAEDFTVRGGSSEATSPEKWQYAERLALAYRMPCIRLVETAGGSVNLLQQSGATKIPGYAHWPLTDMLGEIPVIAVALGAAAGLGAVRVVASHFSVMTAGTSWVFAAGPAVVRPGVGEDVDKEQLGGSHVHAHGSGVVDNEAAGEHDALNQVARFLSYLPQSVYELPVRQRPEDPADRIDQGLVSIIPESKRRAYKMRNLLDGVFDTGSSFEIGRYNGRSVITMLSRLHGYPVAVLANDPLHFGGSLTAEAAEKIIRFVDLADTFHLPVVNFVDQPGTYVGTAAEARGTVRKGVRAAMAIEQATVPWCSVFVRRAFGLAGGAYAPIASSINWRYAWPTAYWGSIPIEGGVEAAYKREIAEAADSEGRRSELIAGFAHLENPFRTAERFGIQEIIDPRVTRPRLCAWIERAYRILPENCGKSARTMRA